MRAVLMILAGVVAMLIGAPAASAEPTSVASGVCSMLDSGSSMLAVENFVIDQLSLTGEFVHFDAAVAAQRLVHTHCPEHVYEFGSI